MRVVVAAADNCFDAYERCVLYLSLIFECMFETKKLLVCPEILFKYHSTTTFHINKISTSKRTS